MYERFYRLRERPFALTPDPDYLYPSRVHKEALSYLRYGIESHAGFVVITGAIGSGKTTLLQTMLRGLDGQTTVARVIWGRLLERFGGRPPAPEELFAEDREALRGGRAVARQDHVPALAGRARACRRAGRARTSRTASTRS